MRGGPAATVEPPQRRRTGAAGLRRAPLPRGPGGKGRSGSGQGGPAHSELLFVRPGPADRDRTRSTGVSTAAERWRMFNARRHRGDGPRTAAASPGLQLLQVCMSAGPADPKIRLRHGGAFGSRAATFAPELLTCLSHSCTGPGFYLDGKSPRESGSIWRNRCSLSALTALNDARFPGK